MKTKKPTEPAQPETGSPASEAEATQPKSDTATQAAPAPEGAVSKPISNKDGTDHIVAACPFCNSSNTKLSEQIDQKTLKFRCNQCRRVFKFSASKAVA